MSARTIRYRLPALTAAVCACAIFGASSLRAATPYACDMGRAIEICDSMPLDHPEGVWRYPDDNVTVLIARDVLQSHPGEDVYAISVIATDDCRLSTGETIGFLKSTASPDKYVMTLYTERKNPVLAKPMECVVTLGKDKETFILPEKKSKWPRLRFSINPSTLLPRMWRIVRFGVSGPDRSEKSAPIGLIKIYPSYDGNGSSRRTPRYL